MPSLTLQDRDPAGQFSQFEINAQVWRGKSPKRVIVLVPPTDGITVLDRMLIRRLRRSGASVVALTGFTGAWERVPDWHVHERGLLRGTLATRRLIEWAKEEWGAKRISLIGTSMGAMFAGMAAASEKHVDRLSLIAGGAPVYRVAAESVHPSLIAIRRWRWRHYDVASRAEYLRRLRQSIRVDLADVARPRRGRKDLMFIGTRDLIMPTATQYRLAQQLGNPEVVEIAGGHLKTIAIAQTLQASRICEFSLA